MEPQRRFRNDPPAASGLPLQPGRGPTSRTAGVGSYFFTA